MGCVIGSIFAADFSAVAEAHFPKQQLVIQDGWAQVPEVRLVVEVHISCILRVILTLTSRLGTPLWSMGGRSGDAPITPPAYSPVTELTCVAVVLSKFCVGNM